MTLLLLACSEQRILHNNSNDARATTETASRDVTIEVFKFGLVDGKPIKWDNITHAEPELEMYKAMVELEEKNGLARTQNCSTEIPSRYTALFQGQTVSFKEFFRLANGQITLGQEFYLNGNCNGQFAINLGDNYQLSKPKKVEEDGYTANAKLDGHMIFASDAGAEFLSNRNYCGISNWDANNERIEKGLCSGRNPNFPPGTQLFDQQFTANIDSFERDNQQFTANIDSFERDNNVYDDRFLKLNSRILGSLNQTVSKLTQIEKRKTSVDKALYIVGCSEVSATAAVSKSTVMIGTQLQNGGVRPFCTGTLIGPRYVITAAHCIQQANPQSFLNSLVVGFSGENILTVKVESLKRHETYSDDYINNLVYEPNQTAPSNEIFDIAVLKMVSNAPSGFSPIAILPDNIKVEKTDQLILAGWGLTADAEEIPVLRSTETQINDIVASSKTFSIKSSEGVSSCNGDSGGPAYYVHKGHLFLIGATSYGPAFYQCLSGDGVYVDVRKYTDWLGSALN